MSPITTFRSKEHPSPQDTHGFTLIEVVVVMAIVGVCTWMLSLNLDALGPDVTLDAQAHKLAATLRFGMTQDRWICTAAYDLDTQTYCIESPATRASGGVTNVERLFEHHLPSQLHIERIHLPGNERATDSGECRFSLRLGDDSSTHFVHIRQQGTQSSRVLEVVPLVGEVFIHAGNSK